MTQTAETTPAGNANGADSTFPRKRKADALGRLAAARSVTSTVLEDEVKSFKDSDGIVLQKDSERMVNATTGRGVLSGWTTCPLCGDCSRKRFALGRGIGAHLQSVHLPWNPGTLERKRRRRRRERLERELVRQGKRQKKDLVTNDAKKTKIEMVESWEPTSDQLDAWESFVLILQQRLEKAATNAFAQVQESTNKDAASEELTGTIELPMGNYNRIVEGKFIDGIFLERNREGRGSRDFDVELVKVFFVPAGRDRNGLQQSTGNSGVAKSFGKNSGAEPAKDSLVRSVCSAGYRHSLPHPFLQAAADGDLEALQRLVNTHDNVPALLGIRDKHLSTAEHWAAGGGHLRCLEYVVALDQQYGQSLSSMTRTTAEGRKAVRRRDGKTSLHYAARNGHEDCIRFLLSDKRVSIAVDAVSGDGTTPLHLAFFGGHVAAVQCLLEHGANIKLCNEWGCNSAHWLAMSKCSVKDDVTSLCTLLKEQEVSFVQRQKQGHSPLHKVRERNTEWVAAINFWLI